MFLADGSMRKARLSVSRKSSYAAELQAELGVFFGVPFLCESSGKLLTIWQMFSGKRAFQSFKGNW